MLCAGRGLRNETVTPLTLPAKRVQHLANSPLPSLRASKTIIPKSPSRERLWIARTARQRRWDEARHGCARVPGRLAGVRSDDWRQCSCWGARSGSGGSSQSAATAVDESAALDRAPTSACFDGPAPSRPRPPTAVLSRRSHRNRTHVVSGSSAGRRDHPQPAQHMTTTEG